MQPAGFMSKKYTDAQHSYFTYEHETLGVIEALKKWDDELLGLPEIRVVTDHEALRTFMQKVHAGPRQIRWSQWLTRYRLKFIHVPGSQNRSADALSRKFENPNNKFHVDDLSTVDLLLDPEGDDLPEQRLKERDILQIAVLTRAQRLRESTEPRHEEAEAMRPLPIQDAPQEEPQIPRRAKANNLTVATSMAKEPPVPFIWQPEIGGESYPNLETLCRDAYKSDKTFRKILHKPEDHKLFRVVDRLIYYLGKSETRTLCIPRSEFRGRRLTELVIDQVH